VCEEQRLEAQQKKEKQQKEKVEKLLGGIRLGARYRGMDFIQYKPTCPEAEAVWRKCRGYAVTFPDRLAAGDNLLMLGNYGTGKNMLAACICTEVALQGFTAVHTTVLKMLRRIKTTWRKDSKELEQDVIDSFALPDLLVVDEIGVQFGSEAEKILTFEALNGRYEERKPTIIISNLTEMAELQAYLGERVLDRMREGATGVLNFTWESYRGRR
jgi:DNA replication protein DnaC